MTTWRCSFDTTSDDGRPIRQYFELVADTREQAVAMVADVRQSAAIFQPINVTPRIEWMSFRLEGAATPTDEEMAEIGDAFRVAMAVMSAEINKAGLSTRVRLLMQGTATVHPLTMAEDVAARLQDNPAPGRERL